jgi:hypothetical protein
MTVLSGRELTIDGCFLSLKAEISSQGSLHKNDVTFVVVARNLLE